MTASLIAQTSPDVLANKGVPITLIKTRSDQQASWTAHPDGVTDTYWIRLTNWRLKLLEDQFGSLAKWEQALDEKLLGTIMSTLALALGDGWTEQRVGEAMVLGRLRDYRIAISATYGIALGRDPLDVKKALTTIEGDTEQTPDAPSNSVTTSAFSTTPDAFAGPTSGPGGSDTATAATTSGTYPSDSSSPSSTPWQ